MCVGQKVGTFECLIHRTSWDKITNKDKIYQKGKNYQKSMMYLDSLLLYIFVCTCVYCSYCVSKVFVLCLCLYCVVFVLCSLCLYCVYVFVLCLSFDNGLLDLDARRLARSQNPEGPATGHLDPGFLGFPGS